jgi:hypothetical protein
LDAYLGVAAVGRVAIGTVDIGSVAGLFQDFGIGDQILFGR